MMPNLSSDAVEDICPYCGHRIQRPRFINHHFYYDPVNEKLTKRNRYCVQCGLIWREYFTITFSHQVVLQQPQDGVGRYAGEGDKYVEIDKDTTIFAENADKEE